MCILKSNKKVFLQNDSGNDATIYFLSTFIQENA